MEVTIKTKKISIDGIEIKLKMKEGVTRVWNLFDYNLYLCRPRRRKQNTSSAERFSRGF